jgi:tetratricopeptide (TPR) repeat protein
MSPLGCNTASKAVAALCGLVIASTFATTASAQFAGDEFYNQGLELAKAGRLDDAISSLTKAIEADARNADAWGERGVCWTLKMDYAKAIADFTMAIEKYPKARLVGPAELYTKYRNRGAVYHSIGEYKKAVADFEASLLIKSDDLLTLRGLAWILATCSEDDLRDGLRAYRLAAQANSLTNGENAFILDTLAAAYAECGDFRHAIEYQEAALKLVLSNGLNVPDMKSRLELYRQKKPYRE